MGRTRDGHLLGESLSHRDETRSLLRALYATEADLLPDYTTRTLTVRLHHMANGYSNDAIRKLCDHSTPPKPCSRAPICGSS